MRFFKILAGVVLVFLGLAAGAARAQVASYLQVEAQPSLTAAMERARAYAADFADVAGFRTGSGWYAIVLGPQTAEEAANRLVALRQEDRIPYDSFVVSAAELGVRFWPAGDATAAATETTAPEVAPEPPQAPAAPEVVAETRDEALASEAALGKEERAALQEALKWYGFYDGALDGAIGKGSRKSMAAWQEARGHEATGVLTTAQRAELLGQFQADKAEFGFETVTDAEAGIEVTLPLGLVEFDTYAPPFAVYAGKADAGLTIRLISEPGDAAALPALFDLIQSLDVMPAQGARELGEDFLSVEGRGGSQSSAAFARANRGTVKGYLITWTPALDDRIDRILPVIRASLRSIGAQVLDPGLVPLDEALRQGLIAGLSAKTPAFSRSGLFVTPEGLVATAAQGLAQCAKLTIEGDVAAEILASDDATGLALLAPQAPIAPQAFGQAAAEQPAKGTRVTAVGWSYGTRLPAPVLNPGLVAETTGLTGQAGMLQLALDSLPGDAGGPVLDAGAAVVGLVLPADAQGPRLPRGVTLAVKAPALSALLAQAQLSPAPGAAAASSVTPDELAARGQAMTALVSCWN